MSDAITAQLAFLGAHFTVMTVAVGLLLWQDSAERASFQEELLAKVPGAVVRQLRDDQFYPDFTAAMRGARHSANICYFSTKAPNRTHDRGRRQYYDSLPSLMRSTPHVKFRRLIRYSSANVEWVKAQLGLLRGVPNVAIAVLSEASEARSMGFALSAQIVDDEHVWLVAIESHERESEFRDIYVHDKTLGRGFNKYFQRLWSQATPVLEWGEVTPEGEKLMASSGAGDGAPV